MQQSKTVATGLRISFFANLGFQKSSIEKENVAMLNYNNIGVIICIAPDTRRDGTKIIPYSGTFY